jgi:elongator complex protein 3
VHEIITALLELLRAGKRIDNHVIKQVVMKHAVKDSDTNRRYAKKNIVPYLIKHSAKHFNATSEEMQKLLNALQIKPRRTASGVATITVMTKPWTCASACIYCPNDVRMPKSYLSDEPVCQRAEIAYFDPYLQTASRLRALKQMGHTTDKIEIIILGGTWNDYSENYRIWYTSQIFRALNESEFLDNDTDFANITEATNPYKVINNSPTTEKCIQVTNQLYADAGIENDRDKIKQHVAPYQAEVENGIKTFNAIIRELYVDNAQWQAVSNQQISTYDELEHQQKINETSKHRVVGLVIETRPDSITAQNLQIIRRLGCTKVQIGIQSLDEDVLARNQRKITLQQIRDAFALLRLFGFKIHVHFMLNLLGSSIEQDGRDYLRLVTDPDFMPDEVKLYPCMLVGGTELVAMHQNGVWQPYSEDDLVDLLVQDTVNTPRWTRISRMIRDISAHDIIAGNKKSNLRQVVEQKIEQQQMSVNEIRYREVSTQSVDMQSLTLRITEFRTSVADEYFLEWVTPEDKIAGFLRLSLPFDNAFTKYEGLPTTPHQAMIREVHVYGRAQDLNNSGDGSQHKGLGKKLISEAEKIATEHDYKTLYVISAVGTREYYRSLGCEDDGLYQRKVIGVEGEERIGI